ncbi:hypothetical protein MOQ72_28445 [Saccharopolyspora sp. K220]|uniref:hypothetical protein n=1 Tax=Saccharopolyspora soli TaxID=2926618 RepID=UPI001F5A81F6|nr:hypothetical protein [Saccharopolyspora soli]MCI2421375.1 hypothetical protein [Saccharopolyspora soli]
MFAPTAKAIDGLEKALAALGLLDDALALNLRRQAGVSRTFVYQNPQGRQLVAEAITASTAQHSIDRQTRQHRDELDAAWRERALNAEDALAATHREIVAQRQRIAGLMGQVRDLEQTWCHDGLHRLITENTTLKHRIRQLTDDNQTLTDKLAAARSNARADLEVQLLQPAAPSTPTTDHPNRLRLPPACTT